MQNGQQNKIRIRYTNKKYLFFGQTRLHSKKMTTTSLYFSDLIRSRRSVEQF